MPNLNSLKANLKHALTAYSADFLRKFLHFQLQSVLHIRYKLHGYEVADGRHCKR